MISVATMTYKRLHILEEAIYSFISQGQDDCEMVVLNDNKDVDYFLDHKNVRIINHKERFNSIGEKLKFCFDSCKNNFIYRLDDDDLLWKDGLANLKKHINSNPGYDIYRSQIAYFLVDNEFKCNSSSINNGNCYTKQYLSTITDWKKSCNEDDFITFHNNGTISTTEDVTMMYRWGMGTFHISGIFSKDRDHKDYLDLGDRSGDNLSGKVEIKPHFKNDYYNMIKDEK